MKRLNYFVPLFAGLSFFATSFSSSTLLASAPKSSASGGPGGFYLEGSFAPVLKDQNDSIRFGEGGGSFAGEGQVSTAHTLGYDLRSTLGYVFGNVFLVGISYDTYSTNTKRDAVKDGDNGKDSKTMVDEYGPTIGFLHGGWRLSLTYLLSSTYKYTDKQTDSTGATTSDIDVTLSKATGYLINLGYSIAVTNWLEVGPSLIYRTVTYSNETRKNALDSSSGETFTDRSFDVKATQTNWSPYFSVTARF
jgi:hypothetical protein